MIRRLLLILVLLLAPLAIAQANDVAHGAEKDVHEAAHKSDSHGEENEAPKTYFGIPANLLKFANMLLFLGILGYLVRKPVREALSSRSAAVATAHEQARTRQEKADHMASEIRQRLDRLEADVKSMLERAETDGERQKRELMELAQTEVQKLGRTTELEIGNRMRLARQELTTYAGELAAARASQLVQADVRPEDQKRIFAESVSEIEGAHA